MKFKTILIAAVAIIGVGLSVIATPKPEIRQPTPTPEIVGPAPEIAPAPPVTQRSLLAHIVAALSVCFVLGTVTNAHATIDANNRVTTALPAANAANYSTAINLFTGTAGRIPGVELDVELPATPSLADTHVITLTVKDSADGVTFAAVADLPVMTATGAGGDGGLAISRRFKLPIGVRQYLRLDAAVDSGAGDSTAISTTLGLVF